MPYGVRMIPEPIAANQPFGGHTFQEIADQRQILRRWLVVALKRLIKQFVGKGIQALFQMARIPQILYGSHRDSRPRKGVCWKQAPDRFLLEPVSQRP